MLAPLRFIFFCLSAPPLLIAVILFTAFDNVASTNSTGDLSLSDIQWAKKIVNKPSTKKQQTIHLSDKDLNIALSYLLNNYRPSSSQISVKKDHLLFNISIQLNNTSFGKFLNFSFILSKHQGYPAITSLAIGKIHIADEFAGLILESIIKYTPLNDYYILAAKHFRDIQISAKGVTITYIPTPDLHLTRELKHNTQYYQSIIYYQKEISNIIAQHDPKWRLSLADLLQPLFKLAYERSIKPTAKAENRAVLIAVGTYVNKNEIQSYLPIDISLNTAQQYPASLYKRTDMAKHFMASAVLSATGAGNIAHLLGEKKELNDAKQGSGFSFIDLAGDRAGLQFGKFAVSTRGRAKLLQKRMMNIKDYTAFMPDVTDLPENMDESEFKQKYESIYSAKYQKMLKKIDRRISSLAIYQY